MLKVLLGSRIIRGGLRQRLGMKRRLTANVDDDANEVEQERKR